MTYLRIILIFMLGVGQVGAQKSYSLSGGLNLCYARVRVYDRFDHYDYTRLLYGYNVKFGAETPLGKHKLGLDFRFSTEGHAHTIYKFIDADKIRATLRRQNIGIVLNLKHEYLRKKKIYGLSGGIFQSVNLSTKWNYHNDPTIIMTGLVRLIDAGFVVGGYFSKKPKKHSKRAILYSINYYHGILNLSSPVQTPLKSRCLDLNIVLKMKKRKSK